MRTVRYTINVSIPSRGSGKGDIKNSEHFVSAQEMFQSPLGEVVKETLQIIPSCFVSFYKVSIPSRGSGKGDSIMYWQCWATHKFQSPLGEVVKETCFISQLTPEFVMI